MSHAHHSAWGIQSLLVCAALLPWLCSCQQVKYRPNPDVQIQPVGHPSLFRSNDVFRNRVADFLRQVTEDRSPVLGGPGMARRGPWTVRMDLYLDGARLGRSRARSAPLWKSLKLATRRAIVKGGVGRQQSRRARFIVRFPERNYSLIEHRGQGHEFRQGVIPLRRLDRKRLRAATERSYRYLGRVIDPEFHGVHKYYYAPTDTVEKRLHTIYTSSLIYTLLNYADMESDGKVSARAKRCAEFVLSMQVTDPDSEQHGAFHYSFFTDEERKESVFPVGTAAKTIFTLLELHRRTGEDKYRRAAMLAADWILKMVDESGAVRPFARWEDGRWWYTRRRSLLYEGQVLSALSRMYGYTGSRSYLAAARRIARRFAILVNTEGTYLGDDYRSPNPISTSWVVLSLLDFHKASQNEFYLKLCLRVADDLVARQVVDASDLLAYGRWPGALSTSGNGWLMEVYSELFLYCRGKDFGDPDRYKRAVLLATRWVLERCYRPANAYLVMNPERCDGGIFWNRTRRFVRTDSVCHGLNAMVNILPHWQEEDRLDVPERPLIERLDLKPDK